MTDDAGVPGSDMIGQELIEDSITATDILEAGKPSNIKPSEADTTEDTEGNIMFAYCGNSKLKIELADNASARAFAEKLKSGDITVTMDDYGNFEKVGSLGFSIVQSNTNITTQPGDVILYQGNNITMYYDQNSWNFTLLGRIAGQTRESMLNFFGGKGEVAVRFSLN